MSCPFATPTRRGRMPGPDGSVAPSATRWTPAAAAARAAEVLRTEGPRALAARAAGEIASRRLFLFERDPAGPASGVESGLDLSFAFVDRDQVDAYELLRPGSRRRVETRPDSGRRCFGTWLLDDLVAVRWFASGSPYIEYLDVELDWPTPRSTPSTASRALRTADDRSPRSARTVWPSSSGGRAPSESSAPSCRESRGDSGRGKANFVQRRRIGVLGRGRARRVFIRRR